MDGKQLRNSILQWAIQGKLVPQDPNDEPASVLLEHIREEKARLIKEKKIKRDKNESIIYRGDDNSYYEKFADGKVVCIDDEIPFEIPQSWEWCRLCNVFETSSGTTPQSKNPLYYSNGTINWVRTTDLNNGILSSCEVKITPKALTDYNLSIIPQNSICIAMYGGGGTIGKHSIIRFDTTINQSVCAIHPNEMCNMEFIHIFMQFQRPFWMDHAAGSRKDPNINQIIIKKCLIPLPPKKEQDRIVEKFNNLIPLLDYYSTVHQLRGRLSEEIFPFLKKSILQEAIQGSLVPQDASEEPASVLLERILQEKNRLLAEGKLKKKDVVNTFIFRGNDNKYFEKKGKEIICIDKEIPFEIPDTWQWCRVKQILDIGSARRVHQKDWRTSGIPFYRAREIGKLAEYEHVDNELFIDYDLYKEFSSSGVPMPGDLMITAVGTLGKVYIVKNDDLFYYKDGSVLCLNNRYNLNPFYLKHVIDSPMFKNQYVGESQGTTVATLTMVRFNEYLLPIPPLREQERIVKAIDNLASIMRK